MGRGRKLRIRYDEIKDGEKVTCFMNGRHVKNGKLRIEKGFVFICQDIHGLSETWEQLQEHTKIMN